ncbi:MAG: hypothetical protein EBX69_04595, partial [Betaproteobacteria bacterium]|nr:hypothetical protein [Betaproteobacteria bacterium]
MQFIGLLRVLSKPTVMNRKSAEDRMTLAPWTSGRLKTELASSPQPEIASSLQLRLQKHAMRLSEPSSWVEAALGASKPQVFFLEAVHDLEPR